MALRSPLTVQPYDYIADSNGRPLDYGQVYIGVANQDPEFYQIPVYLDAAMTKPIDQPIRTNDGFVDFAGSLSELYASAEVYSVKVLDKQGRKVLYKGDMTRKNLMSDALADLNQSIIDTQTAAQITLNAAVNSANTEVAQTVSLATAAIDTATTKSNKAATDADAAIKTLFENGGLPATPFTTKALMTASVLVDGDYAQVTDDTVNNGLYVKTAGAWVKSEYDPLAQAKADATIKADAVKVYTDKTIGGLKKDTLKIYDDGTPLSVDFSNIADGVFASAVGQPPLTALGKEFIVTSGYAVAQASSVTVKSGLWHEYDATNAKMRVSVDSTDIIDSFLNRTGVYVQKQEGSESNGIFFAYNRVTSAIEHRRIVGNALSTLNELITDLPAGLNSFAFEVESLNDGRQYSCVIETEEGLRSSALIVDNFPETISTIYKAQFGIFAAVGGLKISSIDIDTSKSKVLNSIDELRGNTTNVVQTHFKGEYSSKEYLLSDGKAFDEKVDISNLLLLDKFNSSNEDKLLSEHVPSFGENKYEVFGFAQWGVVNGSLAYNYTGANLNLPSFNLAGVSVPLPSNWYHNMRGVEVRAKVVVPSGDSTAAVILRYDEGAVIGDGAGAIVIRRDMRNVIIETLSENKASDSTLAEANLYNHLYSIPDSDAQEVDFIVRCYNSTGRGDVHDLIIAEVNGVRAARFFYEPTDVDTRRSVLRDIKSVGVGVDTSKSTGRLMRIKEFSVDAVPLAGSSNYRSLPPEPAPIVPNFSEPVVVFDAVTEADSNAQVGFGGVLGPSIIPMLDYADKLGITPIDNYYMYYSSNHMVGEGGIWLATAPTPDGVWTKYNGAEGLNRIYVDKVKGNQTEQPQVVYDEVENRLIMIYHNGNVNATQVSILATSTDGISFSRVGFAADTEEALRRSYVQHDGYSSFCAKDPLGIVKGWLGWFRLTGGTGVDGGIASLWSIARSDDGIVWKADLLPVAIPSLRRPMHEQNVLHNIGYGSTPFAYMGQRLLPITPFKSAGLNAGGSKGYLAITRLGDDMRNMSADEHVIEKTLPTEEGVLSVSSVFVRGNTLYLYYIAKTRYLHLITADLSKPPKGVTRTLD